MSSETPTMDAVRPRMNLSLPQVPARMDDAPLLASSVAFRPRRSSLVFWTVRMAQAADRVMGRTRRVREPEFSAGQGIVEKTLNGLDRCCRLIPTHQGVVAAERARLQIEAVLETRRERHQRFQRLRQDMESDSLSIEQAYLYLNPGCRWIRMCDTMLPGQHEAPSGSVLFFLSGDSVQGLHMSLEGQVLINELADYQPCTIRQWANLSTLADARQLTAMARHWADIGLVAWEIEP